MTRKSLTRRRFLQASGVALAMPVLEATTPVSRAGDSTSGPRRRIVAICYPVGMHGPFFFPQKPGRDYALPRYLEPLEKFRNEFTVFSGLSHARILRSHTSDRCFLTGAPYERQDSFRNTISLDQLAAGHVGGATRFSSLPLGTGLSWTQSGVRIPGYEKPSQVFARLFLAGSATQIQAQTRRLQEGKSILDAVAHEARQMNRDLPERDRARLEEYFASVRQLEQRMTQAEEWEKRPRPKVTATPPRDVSPTTDPLGHLRLMYDLIHLAFVTDSTRLITLHGGLLGSHPVIGGKALDYHNLSHHGMDPDKIANLGLIEDELMKAFHYLLSKLKGTKEEGETLLDRTMVLLGSNLSNASSHDTTNLPILLAGGGFKHGQHLVFDREHNTPLCNLFVSMLQRFGLEVSSFGPGKGTLRGLEA
jgi:hypothetical protein